MASVAKISDHKLQKNKNFDIRSLISGKSKQTEELIKLIQMVSKTNSTALILGETGTGKDVIARAIHNSSTRNGPLITVNCAAIPSELLESELFGHEKGSFTGADKLRKGKFEQSSGGSMFLDEIGDMPLPLQAKLLRAIENKTIQRVGGSADIKIDLRLICATHRDLEKKVENGEFRADLFFRINVLPIQVPSLAERRDDIPDLVLNLLKNVDTEDDFKPKFTNDAITALTRHNWPGNVRELKNLIERACILFQGQEVTSTNITENLLRLKAPNTIEEQNEIWDVTSELMDEIEFDNNDEETKIDNLPHPNNYKDWFTFYDEIDVRRHLQDIEIILIEAALEKTNGKIANAADILKLRRTTLIEKMKKFSITKNDNV